jgi:hypothetical protein
VKGGLFWRAATVQSLLVGALFIVLALAVPHRFFTDYGVVVGPLAWVGCALLTGRILKLPLPSTAAAAAVSGAAAAVVGAVVEHVVSLPIAVGVFAAVCAGFEARRPHPPESRRRSAPERA